MIQGNIEEMLEKEGLFIATTVGMSMYPLFKNRRDNVVIKPVTGKLKKYDVPLYKRGDKYILHRIIDIKDGYIIRGDNCYADENVPEKEVIGVLTEFFRRDKRVLCTDEKYLKYVKKRLKTYKIRRFFVLFKAKIGGGIKKLLRPFRKKKA